MSDGDLVEIDVEVIAETGKAMLVNDGEKQVWIPISQIKDQCEENGKITSIFITEWLATEKGLI